MPNQRSARASRSRPPTVGLRRPVAAAALLVVLLAACGGGGDSPQAPPASSAPQPTSPVIPGVGAVNRYCGGLPVSDRNPFQCCGTGSGSGNCTLSAWQVFFDSTGVELPLGDGISEAELPDHIYYYNGKRRWSQRITDPGVALPSRTKSAFAWAHLVSINNDGSFIITDEPVVGSIAVSWTMAADGHVARVIRVWSNGGVTMLDVEDSACLTSTSGRPHGVRTIAASSFQEYIVYTVGRNDPTISLVGAAPATTLKITEELEVAVLLSDGDRDLRQARVAWGDGHEDIVDLFGDPIEQRFRHNYAQAGTYIWTVTVEDQVGKIKTITGTVSVKPADVQVPPPPPVANVPPTVTKTDDGPTTATVGDEWTIRARGEDEEGQLVSVAMLWNDGVFDQRSADGATESERFNRTFSSAGNFSYTITATDSSGTTGTLTGSVRVEAEAEPEPVPDPEPTPTFAITSIYPASPKATNAVQQLSIWGTGFSSGATVRFRAPNGDWLSCCKDAAPVVVDTTLIGVRPNFDGDDGDWRVEVRNPDGKKVTFDFVVQKP